MFLKILLIFNSCIVISSLPFSSSDCPTMCTCRLRPVNHLLEDCDNCDFINDDTNNNAPDDPCHNCDRTTQACVGCNHVTNDVTINSVTCRNIALVDIPFMTPAIISMLDLSENKLTRLYSDVFGQVRHVITLKLSDNVISDIGRDSFRSLGYIQRLELDVNNLTRLDASMFTGAETLENLNLSHNRLESIDAAFTRLTNLTRLDLRHNLLTELSRTTFKGLVNLRYLILTDNKLTQIDSRAFRHLEKLVYLVLKGNENLGLMKSSRFHFHSVSLTYIDLSECGFEHIPRGLPLSTRYLQLRRNKLTALTQTSFSECPHIYTLVLDDNNISYIENGTFDMLIRLQQLWLSNNKLRRIPDVLHASLERLLLDYNLLTELTPMVPRSSLNQLNTLSLTGNAISKIVSNAFNRLIFLDTLRLDFNQIEYIDNTTFNGLTELRILQLSNNPIRILGSDCFQSLVSLESFYLTDILNMSVSIGDDVFTDLGSSLILLDISNSPGVIQQLFSEDFNQFHKSSRYQIIYTNDSQIEPPNRDLSLHSSGESSNSIIIAGGKQTNESIFSLMTELSLIGSQLISLRSDLPKLLPHLLTLQMSGNNWHCDSSIAWFPRWITSNAIVVDDGGEGLICLSPNSVQGKSLLTFSNSDIVYSNKSSTSTSSNRPSSTRHTATKEYVNSYRSITQPVQPISNKRINISTISSSNQYIHNFSGLFPQLNEYMTKQGKHFTSHNLVFETTTEHDSNSASDHDGSNSTLGDLLGSDITITDVTTRLYSLNSLRNNIDKLIDSQTLIILAVTVSLTICAAAILIGSMICITKRTRRLCMKEESIKSTELFASKTSSFGSIDGRKLTSTKDVRGDVNKSAVDIVSLLPNGVTVLGQSTVEVMALVPGRDINHEGPRRVYKWEDF